ncbi:MAG: glutamyl-tRNA reductase [Aquificaceae bacterium]
MESIFAWGLSFKTAPIECREGVACSREEIEYLLPALKATKGIKELVILSTCNRVELYSRAKGYDSMRQLVNDFLAVKGVSLNLWKHSFLLEGREALLHIFSVASSLDSMVVGETQITSQFKEAFRVAKEVGATGKVFNRLYEKALRTAKRVRTETGISKNAVSISYVAVELARKIFGDLKRAKVLLVGAGEMAELASTYMKKFQAQIFITNRTYERAVELAQKLDGHALRFEGISEYISEFDIVILSTSSKDFILKRDEVKKAMKVRKYNPMFIIDISVPRNADPSIDGLDEVFLYNVDDLKSIAEKNFIERLKEKEKGEIILWDEVEKFIRWLHFLSVEDYIIRIKEEWKDLEAKEPAVRRLIHSVVEEIRKQPSMAERLYKIFVKEVEYGNAFRGLSYVYNRADGA